MPIPLIAALLLAAPATPPSPTLGGETVITFAGNGGLRDWQRGAEADVLYVRDRNEQWYRVTLSGACPYNGSLDTLSYTTDTTGTFDRFSRLRFLRYPATLCGVRSIRTSTPPPGQPGAKKLARR